MSRKIKLLVRLEEGSLHPIKSPTNGAGRGVSAGPFCETCCP